MIEGAGGEPSDFAKRLIAGAHDIDVRRLEQARLVWEWVRVLGSNNYSGCETPVQFLREDGHMSWHDAYQAVCVGSCLQELGESVAALERGEIGFDHLAVMANTRLALTELQKWHQIDETRLLEHARMETVTEFRKTAEQVRHMADAEGFLAEQVSAVEGRRLNLQKGAGGLLWLKGVLDPAGGAALLTALEPLAKRTDRDDDRKRDRRLADALVEFVEHGTGNAHLQVTATLETLQGLPGAPAGEALAVPISATTIERWACNCTLTRVVLGPDSMVIDVGRGRRIVRGPGKRALAARDPHCRWPGCSRPGSWCTPHHLVHWAKGGSSNLDNQLLLCSRHHWMAHEGGWQLIRADDGRILAIPPPAPDDLYCRGPSSTAAA
ncbi:MAG TPA: DUF222 domain-containing protein [Candidatus Dormibacteraeota bacterium]|jgi:hypothetical protein